MILFRFAEVSYEQLTLQNVSKLGSVGAGLSGLYLSGLGLKTLPSYIFTHLPNLEWLDIRDNRIIDIPPQLVTLTKLKVG